MSTRIVAEGNSFYEIDEECVRRRASEAGSEKGKTGGGKRPGREYRNIRGGSRPGAGTPTGR